MRVIDNQMDFDFDLVMTSKLSYCSSDDLPEKDSFYVQPAFFDVVAVDEEFGGNATMRVDIEGFSGKLTLQKDIPYRLFVTTYWEYVVWSDMDRFKPIENNYNQVVINDDITLKYYSGTLVRDILVKDDFW